ncbi:MAG TPA: hypothetical protein DCF68_16445 [Cyanothece sp. UBA12306]|nr:hypothetical protein [Cyanothece sp. UBA12306]
MFHPLFMQDSSWLTLICPISLGKELSNDSRTSEIEPKNLHLPLVFALYCKYREYYLQASNQVTDFRETQQSLKSTYWFSKWLNKDSIETQCSSLQSSQAQMIEIQQKMALLGQELTSCQIFLGEEELEIDTT